MSKYLIYFILIFSTTSWGQSGFLQVESEPSAAEIFIDGRNYGSTPSQLITLGVGSHTLMISQSNYVSKTITIQIRANEIEKQRVILEKAQPFKVKKEETDIIKQELGKLTVITNPSEARVYIDEVEVPEKTPFTVENLGAGTHKIKIIKYIGTPYNDEMTIYEDIVIEANKTKLLNVDLMEKIKEGKVILNSNGSSSGTLINLDLLKKQKVYFPTTLTLLCGNYKMEWDNANANSLNFVVSSDKTAVLYLPVLQKSERLKSVSDHGKYIAYDSYLSKMYKPLNEYSNYEHVRWTSRSTWGLLSILGFGSYAVISFVSPNAFFDPAGGAVAAIFTGLFVYLFPGSFERETERIPIPANIEENNQNKMTIKSGYQKLYEIWKEDIDRENQKIRESNAEIETRNAAIPQASIMYVK